MLREENHKPDHEPTTDDLLEFAEWCREMDRIDAEREANHELYALDIESEAVRQTNLELLTLPLCHVGV